MRKIVATAALSFLLVSCVHSNKGATPVQEKNPDVLVEKTILVDSIEKQLGEAIATEIIKTYKILPISEEFQTYANDIAKNTGANSHRPSVAYHVMILDTKDPVSFGLPGGKILISRDMLNVIKNEAEFASLIGNELAHISKQHLIRVLMKNFDYHQDLLAEKVTPRMVRQGAIELLELGYTIDQINEADRLGSTYAMHVGYDILAFENFLKNLMAKFDKKKKYGQTEYTFDMMNHRVSMNQIFIRALEKVDKANFPKSEDRFDAMMKKIKPQPKKI